MTGEEAPVLCEANEAQLSPHSCETLRPTTDPVCSNLYLPRANRYSLGFGVCPGDEVLVAYVGERLGLRRVLWGHSINKGNN